MNIRRFLGLSLVLSVVCLLAGHFGPDTSLFRAINLTGTALFIIGIPVIQSVQPTGWRGWTGIALLEIAALIALAFHTGILSGPDLGGALGNISALAGMTGRLIIGWLTIRNSAFPTWVGGAFLAEGLLNAIGGVYQIGAFANTFSLIVFLLEVAALFGYGFLISRRPLRELSMS